PVVCKSGDAGNQGHHCRKQTVFRCRGNFIKPGADGIQNAALLQSAAENKNRCKNNNNVVAESGESFFRSQNIRQHQDNQQNQRDDINGNLLGGKKNDCQRQQTDNDSYLHTSSLVLCPWSLVLCTLSF